MNYPKFFDDIETIKLQDKLANFLGTFENGFVEFSYLDIVKSAGHSCPTVAGAYLCVKEALKELYKEETKTSDSMSEVELSSMPQRGEIFISFKEDSSEGVAGVIANVMTQITGATEYTGFKGLNGNFSRNHLMKFNDNISSSVKFTRLDNDQSIEVMYNPNTIVGDPMIQELMQKMMQKTASNEEKILFAQLWQQRVENILKNVDQVITIKK